MKQGKVWREITYNSETREIIESKHYLGDKILYKFSTVMGKIDNDTYKYTNHKYYQLCNDKVINITEQQFNKLISS